MNSIYCLWKERKDVKREDKGGNQRKRVEYILCIRIHRE